MMDWSNGLRFLTGVFFLGVAFSQDYDYPTYSEDFLPETSFSCEDRIHGRYYADVETDCQMYHICIKDESGFMKSTKFLCGNGTVFDQRKLVCQDYRKVLGCRISPRYYRLAGAVELQRRYEKRNQAILRAAQLRSEFRDDYDYPTFSQDDMPKTSFSCADKIDGGYYADIETDCQMYHICLNDKSGFMKSNTFLCGNGTVFDQRKLVCQDYHKVPACKNSARYFRLASAHELGQRSDKKEDAIAKAVQLDATAQDAQLDAINKGARHDARASAAQRDSKLKNAYNNPSYSQSHLPVTSFSCKDKVDGGYYADIETGCQMYHVCSKDKFGVMRGTRYLCGNGTVFDQQHLVCQEYGKVHACKDALRYFRNNAVVERARLRTEIQDKVILKAAQFDSERLK